MRRRGLFWLLLLAAAVYALARTLGGRPAASPTPAWSPTPPTSPKPVPTPWVDAVDGACPTSHPVKAKLSSTIFHVPGGASYERTNADRCYLDPSAAEADGLRAAKR